MYLPVRLFKKYWGQTRNNKGPKTQATHAQMNKGIYWDRSRGRVQHLPKRFFLKTLHSNFMTHNLIPWRCRNKYHAVKTCWLTTVNRVSEFIICVCWYKSTWILWKCRVAPVWYISSVNRFLNSAFFVFVSTFYLDVKYALRLISKFFNIRFSRLSQQVFKTCHLLRLGYESNLTDFCLNLRLFHGIKNLNIT